MTEEDLNLLSSMEESGVITTSEKNLRSKVDSITRSLKNLAEKKARIEFEIKRQQKSLTRKRSELKKAQKSAQVKIIATLESGTQFPTLNLQKDLRLQRLDSKLLSESFEALMTED